MVQEVWGPMRGGTQEKPEWVDWDADGDQDLVSGESYGRIHIYENVGNDGYHAFKAPVKLRLANGEIFHITRDKVFGGEHWHGEMGYPSVACVDWDDDGLFDLIIPNETNRVYWMKNIGTATEPAFQFMRQILPDGFSDSPERLEKTRELYNTEGVEKLPYPYEDDIPFYWRTRLALDDFTGDGLIDIVAMNGNKNLVLYNRYRDNDGILRLDNGTQIYFDNGDPIKNPHWMKARNVDWNNDGLIDLVTTQNLFGPDQRSLHYYENVGTAETPVFKEPVGLSFWGETIRYSSHGLQPSFVDWDYDGALDFVGSNESGYFVLFRNAALKHGRPEVTTTRYSLITH
jgi:hypothetical protein